MEFGCKSQEKIPKLPSRVERSFHSMFYSTPGWPQANAREVNPAEI